MGLKISAEREIVFFFKEPDSPIKMRTIPGVLYSMMSFTIYQIWTNDSSKKSITEGQYSAHIVLFLSSTCESVAALQAYLICYC